MENSFYNLDPSLVFSTVEKFGYRPTGRYWQLNSYENRVFDIELESLDRIIVKFYRPGRWSLECILEEHEFLADLSAEGIKAVAPLKVLGNSVHLIAGMYVTVFPRVVGRMPQEFLLGDLAKVGRTLARIHNVGALKRPKFRPTWNMPARLSTSLEVLRSYVDPSVKQRYFAAAGVISDFLVARMDNKKFIRIHGDAHRGNLLDTGKEFFFIDFDDFGSGPVEQDLWMLLTGDKDTMNDELDEILLGYRELRDIDDPDEEFFLGLRGLRILNYGAWIAQRWQDPSFPKLFPDFKNYHYWAEEVEKLEAISWALE